MKLATRIFVRTCALSIEIFYSFKTVQSSKTSLNKTKQNSNEIFFLSTENRIIENKNRDVESGVIVFQSYVLK